MIQLERLARLLRQASQTQGLNPAQWEALRYVSRANFLSNTPGALARYLGATKGTTSQTVLALIKKGLVVKTTRSADARSVILTLSEAGQMALRDDPLRGIEKSLAALKPKTALRFGKGLTIILGDETERQNEPLFGVCTTCAHAALKHGLTHCKAEAVSIPEDETHKLCFHFKMKK
ncbi:MAG: MarR family transcriptional regulator [Alphaproteobacteria bacterium]|nr:MarR family transcriptional regulator [Alphaproteobacteria bacterium]